MVQQQLIASLFAVALVSLGAAVVGLYAGPRESYRGFWFMNGIWGVIDGAVAWSSFVQEPMPLDELRGILAINLGLQAIYVPLGLVMATRSKPALKGLGCGILVQAVALGVVDAIFFVKCGGV